MSHRSQTPHLEDGPEAETPARRSFLARLGAMVVGGVAAIVPIGAGAAALLDPLRRGSRDTGMVRVTRLAALPEDGTPQKFTVEADRVDAWSTYSDTPVGAVYLRRTEDSVVALNVVCPHAGCFVRLVPDDSRFRCPCHNSSFALDGTVDDPASPAPRPMDALAVEVRDDGGVWVRFQNFLPGREEKVPV
ncbi:MAG: Rieske 2Fe-2S domain-containing protein [Longimicrobiales bacterium]|nr:Rieske 2Fe-2S domain-containing protein [Longimicrobiales bacterium]